MRTSASKYSRSRARAGPASQSAQPGCRKAIVWVIVTMPSGSLCSSNRQRPTLASMTQARAISPPPASTSRRPPRGAQAPGGLAHPRRGRRPAAPRHRGAVLRRPARPEGRRRLLLPPVRPAAVPHEDQVRERHRLAVASTRRSTRPTSRQIEDVATAWCASRPAAPAATATRATSSPTARRRPACATASTRCRWSS